MRAQLICEGACNEQHLPELRRLEQRIVKIDRASCSVMGWEECMRALAYTEHVGTWERMFCVRCDAERQWGSRVED